MGIEENGDESTKDPITYNMSAEGHSGTPLKNFFAALFPQGGGVDALGFHCRDRTADRA